jgi:hypothetical protein
VKAWQDSIDSGEVWRDQSLGKGRFAMHLIDRGVCRLAPAVFAMWAGDDGRYEAIYSKETYQERLSASQKASDTNPAIGARRKLEDPAHLEVVRDTVADGTAWKQRGELPSLAMDALELGLVPFPVGVRHVVEHLDGRFEAVTEEAWKRQIGDQVKEELRPSPAKLVRLFIGRFRDVLAAKDERAREGEKKQFARVVINRELDKAP